MRQLQFILLFIFGGLYKSYALEKPSEFTFQQLLKISLEQSLEHKLSSAEASVLQHESEKVNRARFIPGIELSSSYQFHRYTQLIGNNGTNPTYGAAVTYDLHKLFGPEASLAKQAANVSQIHINLTKREIRRTLKKAFFTVREIQGEIAVLKKIIGSFSNTNKILKRQSGLGVHNSLDREQFDIQKSILEADLKGKTSELEGLYQTISILSHMSFNETKNFIEKIQDTPLMTFGGTPDFKSEQFEVVEDKMMLANLEKDFSKAKLELDKFHQFPMPVVFLRYLHEAPTMPSAEGPQWATEVGITIPFDRLLNNNAEKEKLRLEVEKNRIELMKNFYDYKSSIMTAALNIEKLNAQTKALELMRVQSEKLFERAFLYYAQKKTDVIGTLDLFQKYLTSERMFLANELEREKNDADLEYLIGDQSL